MILPRPVLYGFWKLGDEGCMTPYSQRCPEFDLIVRIANGERREVQAKIGVQVGMRKKQEIIVGWLVKAEKVRWQAGAQ
jgi:hypothetical protein